MHQTPRLRVALTSFLLLLYLATSALGVEGSVLCLGQDGHFGIEFVSNCVQSASNNVSPFSLLTQSALQDDCGPCADVALFSGSAVLAASEQASASSPVPLLDVSSFLIAPLPSHDNCLVRPVSDTAYTNRENIASVVLLI